MNKLLKSALSLSMALALMFSLGTAAFADDWYIDQGNISISATESGQTVTQGEVSKNDDTPTITAHEGAEGSSATNTTTNTVTINATAGAEANVTLSGVNIDTSNVSNGDAAISITGQGNVNIELDGDNTVKSAENHAGIEKNGDSNLTGTLTINDKDNNGGLEATGGDFGAGIGGGYYGNGKYIRIKGGTVNANGTRGGAGIGGGYGGDGENISIEGGTVNAKGSSFVNEYITCGGAGIGGGAVESRYEGEGIPNKVYGNGYNITVSDATVIATGGCGAAGIGGGTSNLTYATSKSGSCGDVKISGNANVTATGGESVTIGAGENARTFAAGTAIGNGSTTEIGKAVTPDTSGLYDTGKVVLKNAKGDTLNTIEGTVPDPNAKTASTLSTAPESSPLPVRYYVVTGAEQTWLADSEDGLEFSLNSDSVNVVKVLIDGEEVEFEINDNGDIVISAEVLQALESGAHEIEFVFPDGSCKTDFTVK